MTVAREAGRPHPLAPAAIAMLESVHQHRVITTRQLHELHRPSRALRGTQHQLAALERLDLIAYVRDNAGPRLWYLTERGADAVEAIPLRTETRRKLIRPEQVAGPLRHHTIAINDVGLAFVRAARERGDDCGPQSWRHEIAHPLGPPPGQRTSEQLIADALLTYQRNEPDGGASFHYRFIELDRATMPADTLAAKLTRYARLYRHTGTAAAASAAAPRPLWRERYPVFPGVLLVLAGDRRERLHRRRAIVLRLCAQDRLLTGTPAVTLACCLLDDLAEQGPFAAVFHRSAAPDDPTDWIADDQS